MEPSVKNTLTCDYPASCWPNKWREALPAGNGTIGAAVYGGVQEETILLNHEDLWWKSHTMELPDVSGLLPELRSLMLSGNVKEADSFLAQALKERGYRPRIALPLPLGDLKVVMPCETAFRRYSRKLDMENGEIKVAWSSGEVRFERSLFVSRADDAIVYEIAADRQGTVHAEIFLDLHDTDDAPTEPRWGARLPSEVKSFTAGDYLFYAARSDDGRDFGAVARIAMTGGALTNHSGKLHVQGADKVVVGIKLFVNEEREPAWSRLQAELQHMSLHYSPLLASHAALHGSLFHAMQLDLSGERSNASNEQLLLQAYQGEAPTELVEKMWAYGRYLLISGSREHGNPSYLYGIWCGDYDARFAFNMANENLQMLYWQALSGNMPELLLAVFDYFERMMDDFRTNAKRLYGCRGIYIPAPTTPDSGLLKHVTPHILYWTGGAGWIAQHYYDYYLHTGDVQFLRHRALPFLRETALFYEDFFIVGPDGYYISCPSNSPENTPGNYWDGKGMGAAMESTINATMDFAIAKEVLTHLIEGARIAGMYREDAGRWQDMLKRIPPYEINEDGAVKEWMHPGFTDNYHHRHQSHIYPVFPGTEVTRDNDPALFQAFVAAVGKRLEIGLLEQTGWSLAHMANNYARMGDGDAALECLELLSRSCVLPNFFTVHNDWRQMGIGVKMNPPPVQLDAVMGWSAAVQEMLLFSLPGEIHLLPALPGRWPRGEARGMLARGAIVVSMAWDMAHRSLQVELLSQGRDQQVKLRLPESTGLARESIELPKNSVKKLVFSW